VPVFRLDERRIFPDPNMAHPSGVIAVGGDLAPGRVLRAYAVGIFPWYSEGQPILWHSPDPRFVLEPDRVHVGRTLRNRFKRRPYRITFDQAFERVIEGCAYADRPGQDGTWITDEMNRSYIGLFDMGYAHSVEAWEGDTLVGGLYGVSLGGIFFGESMFARADDASKIAFVALANQLVRWKFHLIDSQVHTEHLERFGAVEIARRDYLRRLRASLSVPTRQGRWSFDDHGPYG
jgi:leucyl/phenylalanyl-tRNA--protein transferase